MCGQIYGYACKYVTGMFKIYISTLIPTHIYNIGKVNVFSTLYLNGILKNPYCRRNQLPQRILPGYSGFGESMEWEERYCKRLTGGHFSIIPCSLLYISVTTNQLLHYLVNTVKRYISNTNLFVKGIIERLTVLFQIQTNLNLAYFCRLSIIEIYVADVPSGYRITLFILVQYGMITINRNL